MGGLGLLAILCGYVYLSIACIFYFSRRNSRIITVIAGVVLVTLPFSDAYLGRVVLKQKCLSEGETTIAKRIIDVEGIGVDYRVHTDSPSYYGYRYVEGGFIYNASHMLERAMIPEGGAAVVIEKKIEPKVLYMLREYPRQDAFYFYKNRVSVVEISTNQELAGFTWFTFRGGWLERIVMAFSGAGPSGVAQCGDLKAKHKKTIEMLHETLRPKSF